MSTKTPSTARPHLACEITPNRVIAARAGRISRSLEAWASRTLGPGTVLPNLASPNVSDPDGLRQAVSEALAEVADRSRDVITIVPDSAVRVVLLEFDTLPAKRPDADAMVRFRLKKSLPFDVDQAVVSYDVRILNGSVKLLATVSLRNVVEEYEAAVRAAGFTPGVVIPSMLGALGMVQADEPTLVVKVDAATTTLAIVEGDQLMLFRTLENPLAGSLDPEQLAADVYPSLVFFEDNYSLQVRRILVAGSTAAAEVGPALQAQSGAQVSDIIPSDEVPIAGSVPAEQLVGVVGALR